MTKEIEVTSCTDCIFMSTEESPWEYCSFPDHKRFYVDNNVKEGTIHKDCPLKTQPLTIKLKE